MMGGPVEPPSTSDALAAALAAAWRKFAFLAVPLILLASVAAFYAIPLISSNASIQWDAADVHYPLQKYFSDRLSSGRLPFWTPYLFSGYPLLANPETGAWYPLNWPFFIAGITPRSIEFELALNAFVACLGAYFFLARVVTRREAAILGAFAYALSGFFAAQSSHLVVFQAAAWFPWLLLAYRRASEELPLRFTALGGLVGGIIFLTGHVQGAIFAFAGVALYAAATALQKHQGLGRPIVLVVGMLLGALAVYAIQGLPHLELTARAGSPPDYSAGALEPKPLLTYLYPNWMGTFSQKDQGQVLQHYFYSGFLLLPLAAIGLWKSRMRYAALFLLVPALWYACGKYGGLYWLTTHLPGGNRFGPPILDWFLVSFALAILAAAGADWVMDRWPIRYLSLVLAAVFFVDLWVCNSLLNPLAFAHNDYEELYGQREGTARYAVAAPQLPLTRFYGPGQLSGLGPMLHPLDLRFETTYGYLGLQSGTYAEYNVAARRNPKLRDGLNVSRQLDPKTGLIEVNPTMLPRAYFPHSVADVASPAESLHALETLDPSAQSVILGGHAPVRQDQLATAFVVSFDEDSYRVHFQAASPSLLKLSVAWFPGWHATLGRAELPVLRVDHALMGVVVPAGEGDVEFRFQSNYFTIGMIVSLVAVFALLMMAWVGELQRPTPEPNRPYTLQRRGKNTAVST
jgi:hypothetical protein